MVVTDDCYDMLKLIHIAFLIQPHEERCGINYINFYIFIVSSCKGITNNITGHLYLVAVKYML